MMQIGVIDANDMIIEADLDGNMYNIGLSWNEEGKLWTISIRDLSFSILASGIALVPNWPVLHQMRRPEFPPGEIAVYSATGLPLGRKSFVDGEAFLLYYNSDDFI